MIFFVYKKGYYYSSTKNEGDEKKFHRLGIHPFLILFSDFSIKNYKQICISGFCCFSF